MWLNESRLGIIWDVVHNTREQAQSTMGLVKSNTVIFTTLVEMTDTLDEYYRLFKAHVDTTREHDGNPVYHGAIYSEDYNVLTKSKRYNMKTKLDSVEDTDVKKMKAKALKPSARAYLGCLF